METVAISTLHAVLLGQFHLFKINYMLTTYLYIYHTVIKTTKTCSFTITDYLNVIQRFLGFVTIFIKVYLKLEK